MQQISIQEIGALVELADRAPKTASESLWLQELVVKVNQMQKVLASEQEDQEPEQRKRRGK